MLKVGSQHIWGLLRGQMKIVDKNEVFLRVPIENLASGEVVEVVNATFGMAVIEKSIVAELKAGDLAQEGSAPALPPAEDDGISFLQEFNRHRKHLGAIWSRNPYLVERHVLLFTYEIFFDIFPEDPLVLFV